MNRRQFIEKSRGVVKTDHQLTNSPTVARRKDGQYVLIYKSVPGGKMPLLKD